MPEVVESILKHNLFGLDIDKRAAQLRRFAILLKAASKHRGILKSGILPRVFAMPEPAQFTRQEVLDFLNTEGIAHEETLTRALKLMQAAQNLGSIMQFSLKQQERELIVKRFYELEQKSFREFSEEAVITKIRQFINVLDLLTMKYEPVAANPSYMGRRNMNSLLGKYVDTIFPLSKSDLMAVYIDLSLNILVYKGQLGMINLPSWMFLGSFENLRSNLVGKHFIASLLHQERGIFGSDFGSVCFIIAKDSPVGKLGIYRRLFIEHVKVDSVSVKKTRFLDKKCFF